MNESDIIVTLSAADTEAINRGDSNYINNKGAASYAPETYAKSVEYYRLAAAMGNVQAISNLGYCYLYGRSIEKNLSLAIGYFKIAAAKRSVDAAYKLGDIYSGDKWGVKDRELAIYYYRMAASFIIREEWENRLIIFQTNELQHYPSLCYALGRELSGGGDMTVDPDSAYQFLKHAEIGYKRELMNGSGMYEESYYGVCRLLADPRFDEIRDFYDSLFSDEYEADN